MSNYQLLIRASSASDFLKSGRSKADEFGETAINLIKSIAISDLFGLKKQVSSKEMQKGIDLEHEAIELVNLLEFNSYKKNDVRITKDGFTGECDIDSPNERLIRDVKCAWSADTFSWTEEELLKKCKKLGYEEQLRIYMMLYNRDRACIDEVLLTTPSYLVPVYEDADFHEVDHIPESKRKTTVFFNRDLEWEQRLLERYAKAEKIYDEFINQITIK